MLVLLEPLEFDDVGDVIVFAVNVEIVFDDDDDEDTEEGVDDAEIVELDTFEFEDDWEFFCIFGIVYLLFLNTETFVNFERTESAVDDGDALPVDVFNIDWVDEDDPLPLPLPPPDDDVFVLVILIFKPEFDCLIVNCESR